MVRYVILNGERVAWRLKRSKRKSISANVDKDGILAVSAPLWVKESVVSEFLTSRSGRILDMLGRSRRLREYESQLEDRLEQLMEKAKAVIPERVRYYSEIMGVDPASVRIGRARTRFGSCSSAGNLNFSCRVMAYSANAVDYVIVHELSHLKYMNHGKDFWRTVEKYKPDYKTAREELKSVPE